MRIVHNWDTPVQWIFYCKCMIVMPVSSRVCPNVYYHHSQNKVTSIIRGLKSKPEVKRKEILSFTVTAKKKKAAIQIHWMLNKEIVLTLFLLAKS